VCSFAHAQDQVTVALVALAVASGLVAAAQDRLGVVEDEQAALLLEIPRGTNFRTTTVLNYQTTLEPFQTRQNTTIIKV
jgi:uncharacterized membrane protein